MTDRDRSSHDAGRGAAEQARRAEQRARRLRQQLARAEQQQRSWRAGSEGERLVAEALRRAQWPTLHDLPWPGRPRANIDHLAIATGLIWLIDAKHWSGDVVIRGGVLRQNGYRRDAQLAKVQEARDAMTAALGAAGPHVRPVLCLTSAGRHLPAQRVGSVLVVGLDHLGRSLGPPPQNYEQLPPLMERVRCAAHTMPVHPSPGEAVLTPPIPPPIPTPIGAPDQARLASARATSAHRASGRPARGARTRRPGKALLMLIAMVLVLANIDRVMPLVEVVVATYLEQSAERRGTATE